MINTKSDDWSAARMDPETVDMEKCARAASLFKEMIDADQIESNYQIVQAAWAKLSNNERLAVDAQLQDKAPDSKKKYKNLLKEYLDYVPVEPESLP